jgi:hypothetical protein
VRDIGLAVVFNMPAADVPARVPLAIATLRQMYERAFPQVRFYADLATQANTSSDSAAVSAAASDTQQPRHGLPHLALTGCMTGVPMAGYSAHNCINAAAAHAFGRLGLVWLMDDGASP